MVWFISFLSPSLAKLFLFTSLLKRGKGRFPEGDNKVIAIPS
jgi:hypothetical protein